MNGLHWNCVDINCLAFVESKEIDCLSKKNTWPNAEAVNCSNKRTADSFKPTKYLSKGKKAELNSFWFERILCVKWERNQKYVLFFDKSKRSCAVKGNRKWLNFISKASHTSSKHFRYWKTTECLQTNKQQKKTQLKSSSNAIKWLKRREFSWLVWKLNVSIVELFDSNIKRRNNIVIIARIYDAFIVFNYVAQLIVISSSACIVRSQYNKTHRIERSCVVLIRS